MPVESCKMVNQIICFHLYIIGNSIFTFQILGKKMQVLCLNFLIIKAFDKYFSHYAIRAGMTSAIGTGCEQLG